MSYRCGGCRRDDFESKAGLTSHQRVCPSFAKKTGAALLVRRRRLDSKRKPMDMKKRVTKNSLIQTYQINQREKEWNKIPFLSGLFHTDIRFSMIDQPVPIQRYWYVYENPWPAITRLFRTNHPRRFRPCIWKLCNVFHAVYLPGYGFAR